MSKNYILSRFFRLTVQNRNRKRGCTAGTPPLAALVVVVRVAQAMALSKLVLAAVVALVSAQCQVRCTPSTRSSTVLNETRSFVTFLSRDLALGDACHHLDGVHVQSH